MDDLEFRRQIIADPYDKEALSQAEQDDSKHALIEEMQAIDKQIKQALDVPVPDDLAARILLNQSLNEYKTKANRRWSMGLAASLMLTTLVGLSHFIGGEDYQSRPVSEYALQHIYHEIGYADTVDEQLGLQQVNAKLASFGGQLEQEVGHIYYANFCDLAGVKSLHLVMAGESGKVTVFVVPKQNDLEGWQDFKDKRYQGETARYQNADVILVGEHGEPLNKAKQKLEQSLSWSI